MKILWFLRIAGVTAPALTLSLGNARAGSATWATNPSTRDWNTAANWTPTTVPNGPDDTATFGISAGIAISLSAAVEVGAIIFKDEPYEYQILINPGVALTISGTGVTNSTELFESIIVTENKTTSGALYFTNSATAGNGIVYQNQTTTDGGQSPLIQFEDSSSAGVSEYDNYAANYSSHAGLIEFQGNSTAANSIFRNTGFGDEEFPTINFRDQASAGQGIFTNEVDAEGQINFYDSSTADQATFTNEAAYDSSVNFWDHSTAGNATIINEGSNSAFSDNEVGLTFFLGHSSAGNGTFVANGGLATDGPAQIVFQGKPSAGTGTFTANGGEVSNGLGGIITVGFSSTADHGTFHAYGGKVAGALGGIIYVSNSSTAANGTFYAYGTTVDGAFGGRIRFDLETPTAANATLIATGGIGDGEGAGGGIIFKDDSTGGQARVEVFGNGFLDLREHDTPKLTIGSLEGDGFVFLGNVTLSVGSNNLDTLFSGVIEENSDGTTGALTKKGSGTLTLTGSSTYSGGTTIVSGNLLINNRGGSATGSGPVLVKGGRLGGQGLISGSVTFEKGSALMPGQPRGKRGTIATLGQLTFNEGSEYHCGLNSKTAVADKVVAHGVTISGARFGLFDPFGLKLPTGTILTVVTNTSADPISGTFSNLPDGFIFTAGLNTFQTSYKGGDGNDLVLTVQ